MKRCLALACLLASEVLAQTPSPITQLPADGASSGDPVRFTSTARWETAGYNDEEIVYTIVIRNEDTRIIHCNVELHGFYFDNGTKHSISDRQGTTIFPGRQAGVGHWLGMDEKSGATYQVKCRAVQ